MRPAAKHPPGAGRPLRSFPASLSTYARTFADYLHRFTARTASGRAHLWIDNLEHTWQWARDNPPGAAPQATGGTLRIALPSGHYRVDCYDPCTGELMDGGVVPTSGDWLELSVSVAKDIAIKIMPDTSR